jgi:elongation factor 1-alpha
MNKPALNVVFAGHTSHGKSTLVGRLFHDLGLVDAEAMERLRKHAEAAGKPSSYLAFFTDTSLASREQGLTIEMAVHKFETEGRRFSLIDVPGHRDYIKNMISGAAMADAAVLVVDGTAGEAAPQTKEHLVLLQAFGIRHLIVAVNKLDTTGFSKDKFANCRLIIEDLIKSLAYQPDDETLFIPISALEGDNVVRRSQKTPWYRGPSLFEALDTIRLAARPADLPLRMPVVRVFNIPGTGAVITGMMATGTARPGDPVIIAPYSGDKGALAEIGSIEWHHNQVETALAGDDVGMLLTNAERGFLPRLVKKGAVLGSAAAPPRPVKRFKAQLHVVDHPSKITKGYAPYLHVHQAAMPCTIEEILQAVSPSGEPKEEASLGNGDTGVVWIRPQRPLVMEKFASIPQLGRFVLRDGGTVATGTCLETE